MIILRGFLDNREELFIGGLFGLSTVFISLWWAVPAAILCAILWRLGGTEGGNKWFRRMGVGFTMCLSVLLSTYNLLAMVPLAMLWGPLSLGYGVPDATDKGSALGAFFYKICKHNQKLADLFTRMTIGILCAIALLPFLWISTIGYWFMAVFIVIGFPLLTLVI